MTGTLFAHYEIEAELGRGGMGIVYRARDTKLDRTVALKVLPSSALASSDDRTRFYREAKAAAQLHHPNIASVFEIDEAVPRAPGEEPQVGAEKRPYIAMEYIEGETLEERIRKGPLGLADAVGVARQVAEALRAAHARNIVHRDVKSANVMLTADGVAKVLDFGLAKTTQSTMLTRQGSTLGTVAYMSPEQARGLDVDGRSDLYSLGTVLYEMVAGRRPFAGDYEQAVVYGILNEDPEPLTSLRTGVPMGLEWIVNKLLVKEARHRYQSAADLIADLETVDLSGSGFTRTRPAVAAPAAAARVPRKAWPWVAALGGALLVGLAVGWGIAREPDPVVLPMAVTVQIPGEQRIGHPSLSPDARYLAFSASFNQKLLLHDLSDGTTRTIVDLTDARISRFTPDGKWLVFEHLAPAAGLSIVAVPDGNVARLIDSGRVPSWIDDEWLLYENGGAIERISRITQVRDVIWEPGPDSGFRMDNPEVLPGQRRALVSLVSPTSASIAILDLGDGSIRTLREGAVAPRYVSSGHLLFTEQVGPTVNYTGRLFAQPFDPASGTTRGPAVPVLGERGYWDIGISAAGHLVTTGGLLADLSSSVFRLLWLDAESGRQELLGRTLPVVTGGLDLSPDGTWLAYSTVSGGLLDGAVGIGPLDATLGAPTTTTLGMYTYSPRFEGDSESVLVNRGEWSEGYSVYRVSASGAEAPERLDLSESASEIFHYLSGDGRTLVLRAMDRTEPPFDATWWLVDLESGSREQLGLPPEADGVDLSPDGRWLTYTLQEGGSRLFVMGIDGSGPWQVATDRTYPQWLPGGRALAAIGSDGIYIIPLSMDRGVRPAGAERRVFTAIREFGFRVHRPTGRILVAERIVDEGGANNKIDLVLNWGERLRRDVPVQ